MELPQLDLAAVTEFQAIITPGKPLRSANVRVGSYTAPQGGPSVVRELADILSLANNSISAWHFHVSFERLHPFMDGNGRTGRAIWAGQMQKIELEPFALPFLHRFYYQTLEER
jgi:Fic family protein